MAPFKLSKVGAIIEMFVHYFFKVLAINNICTIPTINIKKLKLPNCISSKIVSKNIILYYSKSSKSMP